MSRCQSYRPRMPTHILQLLDVASRITLFLVGQSGPMCFIFKDRLENKYKTSIGPQVKCSCCPNRKDHCIHSIYVMLKIFKVAVDNPLMWQAGYIDSELEDLLQGKHTVVAPRRLVRPRFEMDEELPSDFFKMKEKHFDFPETKSERLVLDEDSLCPICQQAMSEDMSLSYCRVKCGNNFHLECLKVWARHKSTEENKITCPMCRTPLGPSYMKEIELEEKQFLQKQIKTIKLKCPCAGCGVKDIPNNVHKCVLCTNYELCEGCYNSKKHIKHPFIKMMDNGRWRGAEERRDSELKIKNYIDGKRKESVNAHLLEKLRKVEEDPNKIIDYVASSYPYVSKYISENIDPYKKLGFEAEDMKCQKCSSKKMIFLRRLTCGHFIDHECLVQNIRKEKFYCEEDGTKILKGYEDLVRKEKELEKERQGMNYLDNHSEFDPHRLEEPASQQYNFMNAEEEITLPEIMGGDQHRNSRQFHADDRQIRQRFRSNIVREPVRNEAPIVTQRNISNSREIRVRQVSRSTNHSKKKEPTDRQKFRQKDRKNMEFLIEALIGRKMG